MANIRHRHIAAAEAEKDPAAVLKDRSAGAILVPPEYAVRALGSPDALDTDRTAAAFFGVEPRTLRLWRHTRGLPHIKLTAKVIRYRRSDLEQWLAKHRVAIVA